MELRVCPIICHFSILEQCSREARLNNCSKGYSYGLFFHSQWGYCWRCMHALSFSYNWFRVSYRLGFRSEIAYNFVLCGIHSLVKFSMWCHVLCFDWICGMVTSKICGPIVALPTPQTNLGHWIRRLGILSISQHCESRRLSSQVSELEFRCKVVRD